MKVVFLRSAEADLKDLRRYLLKNFGADTWAASYAKIKQSVAIIAAHPQAGRIPEELEDLNAAQYRQVISGMNRIIYEVRLDTAYIHVVCDTRRDLKGLLMRRLVGAV
ncbi:plasmid stabilization system protein ParE [Variovorax boronicumulans]|uniref:Plasmid stabilization system protein ParE n=1 Tax=Variovorax boronicumulans TaxID=436515 RepID=A0AAW8DXG5_9BURK|nr:type II toxin-antitoxin system RelE/ParE family toxin [Variovorax boronicumulans]MDP9878889.1 plasmid stabilization system protein ParE [Variovorax boronicumulans]MDP9924173.1 plasmid stabilization system protein ParE [Variovorax boronicumulans]